MPTHGTNRDVAVEANFHEGVAGNPVADNEGHVGAELAENWVLNAPKSHPKSRGDTPPRLEDMHTVPNTKKPPGGPNSQTKNRRSRGREKEGRDGG